MTAAVFGDTTRVPVGHDGRMPHALRVDRRVEQVRRPRHAAVRDRRERVEHLHAGDRDAVADRGRVLARSRSTATAGSTSPSGWSGQSIVGLRAEPERAQPVGELLVASCVFAISIVPTFDDSRRMSAVVQCSMPSGTGVRLGVVVRLDVPGRP